MEYSNWNFFWGGCLGKNLPIENGMYNHIVFIYFVSVFKFEPSFLTSTIICWSIYTIAIVLENSWPMFHLKIKVWVTSKSSMVPCLGCWQRFKVFIIRPKKSGIIFGTHKWKLDKYINNK